ncbi:hypothetical protein GQ54DRAFT_295380 [Martensiomyces pterosporus]|nr:hypothetical protein GQ54DRAFT_295380 [Martensiomyces pterosporus]
MAPESTVVVADETPSAISVKKTRPTKPDFDQHKKDLAAIDAQIDKLRKELDEVKSDLGKYDTRKGPHAEKRNKLVNRLQEIRKEQNELRKSRGKVFDKQASLTASISKKLGELKAIQSKSTYKTVEEIDELIAKSEKRIDSGKLKIIDERRLASEISGLRRARKHVEQANAMQQAIESERAELAKVDAELADTNAQALSDEHEKLQAELDAIKASQDEGQQKRSELFSERSRVQKAIDEAWDRKRSLQDDHRRKNNEFYQWQQEERKRKAIEEKQRRIQEQREKRLEIAQEQREEAEIPAFQNEISGCDSLIQYLNSFQPAATGSTKSETSTRPSSAASNTREADASDHVPAGMVAVKKGDSEDTYFAGVAASKSKKKHGRKEKKNGTKSDSLKIPLAVAERLLELKVEIPTAISGIPATIEKLMAKKQHYVDNQKKVTEENKKKAEERIAKLMSELEADEKIAESS